MTPRERLLTVLRGEVPDCVPVAPDFSNMIPARLTGKPFWDLYLYNDPPIWEAYLDCAKHFDIDSLMDGYFPLTFPEERAGDGSGGRPEWERFIVQKTPERIVTRSSYLEDGKRTWAPTVDVFPVAEPAKGGISAAAMHLPPEPERYEPLGEDGKKVLPVDTGPEGLRRVKELVGDQGLVGVSVASTCAFGDEEGVYRYYDNPDEHQRWAAERRFELIVKMETEMDLKPDFLCVGGSGTLVFQTEEMFRRVAFPAVKRAIELVSAAGLPTHVHSCGPERKLVQIMAEETGLTVIDPLEVPPMGDCDLAELKRLYGDRIVLKGNLHTTDVMLRGSVDAVVRASRKAIDEAAAGGASSYRPATSADETRPTKTSAQWSRRPGTTGGIDGRERSYSRSFSRNASAARSMTLEMRLPSSLFCARPKASLIGSTKPATVVTSTAAATATQPSGRLIGRNQTLAGSRTPDAAGFTSPDSPETRSQVPDAPSTHPCAETTRFMAQSTRLAGGSSSGSLWNERIVSSTSSDSSRHSGQDARCALTDSARSGESSSPWSATSSSRASLQASCALLKDAPLEDAPLE